MGMSFYFLFPCVLLLSPHVELADSLGLPSHSFVNFLPETKLNLLFFFGCKFYLGHSKRLYLTDDSAILPKYFKVSELVASDLPIFRARDILLLFEHGTFGEFHLFML